MATISGNFTAVGVSSVLRVPERGDNVTVAISGTYNMDIYLERALGPDLSAWAIVKSFLVEDDTVDFSMPTARYNEIFRLNCKVDDGGTANYTLADTDKVLDEFKDSRGNVLMTIKESGVELPDDLTVTGNIIGDGNLAIVGDITVIGTLSTTGLVAGTQVHLRSADDTPVLIKRAVASTGADSVVLTVAQLFNGIMVQTPTGATTLTTPTGAAISAALSNKLEIGDSFQFSVLNLGGAGDIITFTAGSSGVTITGQATIDDAGADITSSGTFMFVNTATDTWIAYRIG